MLTVKRLADLFLSLVGLTITLPLLVLVAVAVRALMGRPVIYCQKRTGKEAVPFDLYKFRTMTEARDAAGRALPDAERLTQLGRFLRRWSLDELPQFWNVLKGDMSIIGPRPLLVKYVERYSPEQARRHIVRPGITGWAQVNGRNEQSWEKRFTMDVWYVDHWSLWLDLRILLTTVVRVLTGRGIRANEHETMPEFEGSGRMGQSCSAFHEP